MALVITIVVLLILAGVSINFMFGADGIFTKSQYAAEKYKNAQEEENVLLSNYDIEVSKYTSRYTDSEIDNKIDYKKFMMNENGYAIGNSEISLPTSFREIIVKVALTENNGYTFNILYDELTDNYFTFNNGYGNGSINDCVINVSKTKLRLLEAYLNNENKTTTSKIEIFYR